MADLKETGFKFYKIHDNFEDEAIEVNANGGLLLLKPEISVDENTKEKFVRMSDVEGNYYSIDGSDDRFEWKGSHFL